MIPAESEEEKEDAESEEGDIENDTVMEFLIKFWDELKNFRKDFNLNDCACVYICLVHKKV